MNESEAWIRRSISHVEAASGKAWTKRRFEAWVTVLRDLPAEHVHAAAHDAVKEWRSIGQIPVGEVRQRAIEHRRRGTNHQRDRELPEWNRSLVMEQASAIIARLKGAA